MTIFNRVLSSLYEDRLSIKFLPSQGILQEQLDAYNTLSQSDYLEMQKAKLDYDWAWDALFFGKGYMETLRFNTKRKIMEPSVINPLMFGYDPYFDEVQSWRYYWKWMTKSKVELKKLIESGVIDGVKSVEDIPTGVDPYLWDYKTKTDAAKKGVAMATESQSGDVYQILEFYGYDKDGDKAVCWTDKNVSQILFSSKLDLKDGEDIVAPDGSRIDVGSKWPLVVKEVFRQPHSSIQFSVADLLEDKHRAKSVLLNLAFIAAKDKANPLYQYNPDKVKDVAQLFSRQISQHIPVEDITSAIAPITKENPMDAGLLNFISILASESNDLMGTGSVAQPQNRSTNDTATEAAIDEQLNQIARSLQAKVLQFGESEFWSHWFNRYKKYGSDLGTKIANVVGINGVKSVEVELSDFKTNYPPGVLVFSKNEAEYKDRVIRADLMQIYPELAQTLGPDGLRQFNKHVFFPKFLHDPSLVDVMFPETLDETKAKTENEALRKNEYPPVGQMDDHLAHIYIHQALQPKSLAVFFHIAEHQAYLDKQKSAMMAQQAAQGQTGAPPGQPPGGQPGSPPAAPMNMAPAGNQAQQSMKPPTNPSQPNNLTL